LRREGLEKALSRRHEKGRSREEKEETYVLREGKKWEGHWTREGEEEKENQGKRERKLKRRGRKKGRKPPCQGKEREARSQRRRTRTSDQRRKRERWGASGERGKP